MSRPASQAPAQDRVSAMVVDPPAAGAWNMAVDEALMEHVARTQGAWLRFYAWETPTLSLGYFQPYAERASHTASAPAVVVRRATGGGAILHHHEITYCLAIHEGWHGERRSEWLYGEVHQALIDALRSFGVEARLHAPTSSRSADEPFLCFERRGGGDVILGRQKIAGSAQRRRHGATLQHGSLLLRASPLAPELLGVEELAGRSIPPEELVEFWSAGVAQRLKAEPRPATFDKSVVALARSLADEKYGVPSWTNRR